MVASYAETARVAHTTESEIRDIARHAESDRCQEGF